MDERDPPCRSPSEGDTQCKPPAQLRKAKKVHQKARKDSHTKRQNVLEDQIKKAKKTKDMDKIATEITRMKRGKCRNKLHQNMRENKQCISALH
eukprot:15339744-Ditylum_brightwellii.AAC.1